MLIPLSSVSELTGLNMGRDESYIKNFVTGLQLLENETVTIQQRYFHHIYTLSMPCAWHVIGMGSLNIKC